MSEEMKNTLNEEELANVTGGSEYEKDRVMTSIEHLIWIYDDGKSVEDLHSRYLLLAESINSWYHAGILDFYEWIECADYLEQRYAEIRALYG